MVHLIEPCIIDCAEVPNIGEDALIERRTDKGFYTSDKLITSYNVDAGS
jgi:hypothetical protein